MYVLSEVNTRFFISSLNLLLSDKAIVTTSAIDSLLTLFNNAVCVCSELLTFPMASSGSEIISEPESITSVAVSYTHLTLPTICSV